MNDNDAAFTALLLSGR